MKILRQFAALCLLAPSGSIAFAQTGQTEVSSSWIAFETIDQSALPIVRARLNGTSAQRLVLDVGFNDFVLDTLLVDGSGLKLASQGESKEIEYYGKKESVPVAVLERLDVGDLRFNFVRTLLIEGEDGTGMGGIRSYGRIGRDLLEPLRLTVHYPRRLLLLEPSPEGEVPDGGALFQAAGRFLLVPVAISWEGGSETVPFVLDAGTSNTVVDSKWAIERGIAAKGSPTAKLASLHVGGFEKNDAPVLLGEMKALPYQGQPAGVIGADLLLEVSVTYDFARDLIWLVSLNEAKEGPS
jgi:hypothetical protein